MSVDALSEYQAYLPSGAAWPRASGTNSRGFAAGLSKEFERIAVRVEQLLLEMDPRTTTELIGDWERVTGLPDPCLDAAPITLEGRRAAVVARFVGRGSAAGPGVAFLRGQIQALGYPLESIIIRRFHRPAFTCQSRCNARLHYTGAGWPSVWEIIVKHGEIDNTLVCQISNRYSFAHLALTFAFPLFFFGDGSFSRAGVGVLTDPATGDQVALSSSELGTFYFGD